MIGQRVIYAGQIAEVIQRDKDLVQIQLVESGDYLWINKDELA